jgi:calcineurin-like phosphoesterase family protein
MGTTFYTSDTHMGHLRICQFCNRPWLGMPIEVMNEDLIARHNAIVSPEDKVIHFGDAALGNFVESMAALARMNGDKYLVPGNHDRCFSGDKRAAKFRAVYEDAGFTILDEVIDLTLTDQVTGDTIQALGSHFPYDGDSHGEDRYTAYRPIDNGLPIVHGHVHDAWLRKISPEGSVQVNVGIDAPATNRSYAPLAEQTVVDLLLGRITDL